MKHHLSRMDFNMQSGSDDTHHQYGTSYENQSLWVSETISLDKNAINLIDEKPNLAEEDNVSIFFKSRN
jgi:hypothetical protein